LTSTNGIGYSLAEFVVGHASRWRDASDVGVVNMIIEELRTIQDKFGYIPAEELRALSQRINVPLYQLHGVASFYPHFHLTPPVPVEVKVCTDMSCHLQGADPLKQSLETYVRRTGTHEVAIDKVSCLGRCDQAPALSINDHIYGPVTEEGAISLINRAKGGQPLERQRPAPRTRDYQIDPYRETRQYGAFRRLLQSRDIEGTLATLKASNLRGLGGAGFRTGLKWELTRKAQGDVKYIVCNADESEPGTIKDREIMYALPHLVIEGMMIAGLVVGSQKGIIYIRHEYEDQKDSLEQALEECQREGLLGSKILGTDFSFDLEIFVSPGGYICGEESALLEALEDRRAEPRNKPPFPVTHGLFGKPTVINNVETFAFVPLILMKGAEWFKTQGQHGASGLKFIGEIANVPGLLTGRLAADRHAEVGRLQLI